jgi:hypothetical protein
MCLLAGKRPANGTNIGRWGPAAENPAIAGIGRARLRGGGARTAAHLHSPPWKGRTWWWPGVQPRLVYRPVDVAPGTADLDVGLVDEPAIARSVAGEPGGVGQQRREPLHPPENRDVVHLDPAFDQQLLDVAVGLAVTHLPAHRHHDHLGREPEPDKGRPRRRPRTRMSRLLHRSSLP